MYIVGSLAALLASFALYVATRPAAFKIARSRTVTARPEEVFAIINDLRRWEAWSPWDKLDPSMSKEYSGPATGPGSSYHWVGNKKVGEGRMTITASESPAKVVIDLHFITPFAAQNVTTFELEARGADTHVTWSMTGENNFVSKAFNVVMNMDKLVGADFDKGLASMQTALASASEAPAAARAA
jgi:hypothetical protein